MISVLRKVGRLRTRQTRSYYSDKVGSQSFSSDDSLANEFSDLFMRKTPEIRNTIDADNSSTSETVVMDDDVTLERQPLTRHVS